MYFYVSFIYIVYVSFIYIYISLVYILNMYLCTFNMYHTYLIYISYILYTYIIYIYIQYIYYLVCIFACYLKFRLKFVISSNSGDWFSIYINGKYLIQTAVPLPKQAILISIDSKILSSMHWN